MWAKKLIPFKEILSAVEECMDSQRKKLTERNDALKAMVMTLKEETMATIMTLNIRIEELEGELALCQATVGGRMSSATLSYEDVLKLKEFVRTRSTDKRQSEIRTWQEFQCELKGQFYPKFIEEEARAKLRWPT
ncbi:hypothetical protein J1N35_006274 [Gossypium stocksii]|uniref:Uncharacterized protein n=1 Tax=Gossypium stocksii TaxID=47602 RepID=A0A9D3WFK6_9ROSI|nr:hypothetical protein J1N35_006274 [Gossypium stocksii]